MAKGKILNTTVHLTDPDTGKAEVWQPGRRLSAADRKRLGWPQDHESMRDAEDDDPEPAKDDDAEALNKAATKLESQSQRGSGR